MQIAQDCPGVDDTINHRQLHSDFILRREVPFPAPAAQVDGIHISREVAKKYGIIRYRWRFWNCTPCRKPPLFLTGYGIKGVQGAFSGSEKDKSTVDCWG